MKIYSEILKESSNIILEKYVFKKNLHKNTLHEITGSQVARGIGIAAYIAFIGGLFYLAELSDSALKNKFMEFCRHKHDGKTSSIRTIFSKGREIEKTCNSLWEKEKAQIMASRSKAKSKKQKS